MKCVLPAALLALGTYSAAQNSPSLGDVARQLRPGKNSSAAAIAPNAEISHRQVEVSTAAFVNVGAKVNQIEAERSLNSATLLLKLQMFDALEQMANSARAGKTRLGGGSWKLYTIYQGLTIPEQKRQATDADWSEHIERLQRWTFLHPNSITARVALAAAYESYAWKARGGDYADKVTEDGWKLFGERVNQAKTTLDEARNLADRCPHWYLIMQEVAVDQGWNKQEMTALLQEAIAFEPEYYYYYRAYARYLLPKWYGEEGDSESFANATSSHIGGKQGSAAYFEIAAALVCNCGGGDESTLRNLSWDKIKEGYAAEVEQYGPSTLKMNNFAYMAFKAGDADSAQPVFEQIGDNWSSEVWRKWQSFEDARAWASQMARRSNWAAAIASAVEGNLQSQEGKGYDAQIAKQFADKFSTSVKQCAKSVELPLVNFDWYVQLTDKGDVHQLLASPAPPHFVDCLGIDLAMAKFVPAPHPAYWVKISMRFTP